MTNGTESDLHSPQHLIAGLLLAAALAFASGCASEPKAADTGAAQVSSSAIRVKRSGRFDALIQKQKISPDTTVQARLPIDSDLSSRLAPLSAAEFETATKPLETALAAIPEPSLAKPALVANTTTESDRADAVSRYLSGREKFADGKFADALDDLVAATRLDPIAPEPYRALADANLSLGRTAAAMRAFREAASRGSDESRLCWILGRDALKSGNTAEAASFLKVARTRLHSGAAGMDRALAALVDCDLADALGANGSLAAMVELRISAISTLNEVVPTSATRAEFGELFRHLGDLFLANGDALTRLGRFDDAAKQYAAAESTGQVEHSAITARWFSSLLRQGRSAEVAEHILAEAQDKPERLDNASLNLIATLAQSQAGDGVRAGLAELVTEDKPSSVLMLLTRARSAAAASTQDSRTILADGLVKYTPDPDSLAAYLSLWPTRSTSDRVNAVIQLVSRRPSETGRFAQSLIAEGHEPASVEAQLTADASVSAELLHTHVLAGWGNVQLAAERSKTIPQSSGDVALLGAILAVRGELAAQVGDWPLADSCIEQLQSQAALDARLAQSNILRSMQRYSRAWAILENAAGPAPESAASDRPRLDILLRGAELAARLGKSDTAMALLRRAAAADPHDDRSYGGMASIISASGAVDQQKLAAVVREVREQCPAGRSMRGLTVQQSLTAESSMDSGSARRLLALVQQLPHDASLIDQLAAFAERSAAKSGVSGTAARDVLAGLLTDRPGSQPVRYALARVLVAGHEAQDAIAKLDQVPRPIQDLQAMRLKEKILRDDLKRPDDAKALEAQRSEFFQPGINPAIESADQLWRDSKPDEAIAKLGAAIAPGAELDLDQQAKILFMANRAMAPMARLPEDPRQGKSPDGLRALTLFDCVALHAGKLLPQHHQSRIILMGVNFPEDFDRLLAAANLAGEQLPTLKVASVRLASDAAATDVPRRGSEFLLYALAKLPETPPPLMTALIRRAVTYGTLEDVQKALDLAEDSTRVTAVLADLDASMDPGATVAQQQAELAYAVASGLTAGGDSAKAEAIYRRALARDPLHGLTNNDLGYALLEKGELEKAAPLIETAAKVLKGRSHVIDSLGWLLYKQGKLNDVPATASSPMEEGAVTVLQHALDLANGNEAAMLDHLGDALWAAGKRTRAAEIWTKARTSAQQTLLEVRATSATREVFVTELKNIVAAADRKLTAIRNNREPEVAAWPGRKEPGTPLAGQEEK